MFANGTVAQGLVGLDRVDVAAHLGSAPAATAGFVIVAPTDTIVAGPQEIVVRARHGDEPPQPIGVVTIDVRAGTRASDATAGVTSQNVHVDDVHSDAGGLVPVIVVHGWALDEESLLPGRGVVVAIGGLAVDATYGYPRPDVTTALGLGPESEPCGFRIRIACDEIEAESAIGGTVRAHLDGVVDGVRWSSAAVPLPADVLGWVALPAANARGRIETVHVTDPAAGLRASSGALEVRAGDRAILTGWTAFDGPGELVALVDGRVRAPAAERVAPERVTAAFPDATPGGFIISLGTEDLAPGYHAVEIFVRDAARTLHPTGAHLTIDVR